MATTTTTTTADEKGSVHLEEGSAPQDLAERDDRLADARAEGLRNASADKEQE